MNKKIISVSIIALIIDQISKILISNLVNSPITIIPNFFKINYVKNYGAAWSIFKGKQVFLIIITLIIFALIVLYSKLFK